MNTSASPPPPPDKRQRRQRQWLWGVGLAVMTALGLVLLFLLTLATNNRRLYEQHYAWLLGLNTVVAGFLLLVLLWMAARLLLRLRQGRFGSRLLLKLAAIFGLVGLLPGLLIYAVSYQFVSRSIESWFDVKVEGALNAGVTLASVTLEALASDMGNNTRHASLALADTPDATAPLVLERMREQLGASEMVLWSSSGSVIASASPSLLELAPTERPSASLLRQLRSSPHPITSIEGLDDWDSAHPPTPEQLAAVRVRVFTVVPAASPRLDVDLRDPSRFVQASLPLPSGVVSNALSVQQAHREYQERALARQGLRRMYIGTLTLSLFLAVFGAVLLAVLLGQQLARPLLLLAQGVRDVARGDLRPKAVSPARDELGGLTRSFALMTEQLLEARTAVDLSVQQTQAARTHLQTILDNLTAGVLVLDSNGHILIANPGASHILRLPLEQHQGHALAALPRLASLAQVAQEQFALLASPQPTEGAEGATTHTTARTAAQRWQQVLELTANPQQADSTDPSAAVPTDKTTLVIRGALLPQEQRLLVFDDISEIVSAQRSQAWAEVARRVAHEIKNPLTPIQLSAQRLELKLSDKLPPTEQALLQRSVKTITDQVAAMLRLVNEFRDYARLPSAVLRPLDLNALVQDILQLYPADAPGVAVQAQLDPTIPPIAGDGEQLRQVIHNLVQNAQDASEQRSQENPTEQASAPVLISTQWLAQAGKVRLSVSDSGAGFPPAILQRAFEPYITTKAKGTGLGLAVVKKIADEHNAHIDLSNRLEHNHGEHSPPPVLGAQVSLSFAPMSAPSTTRTLHPHGKHIGS